MLVIWHIYFLIGKKMKGRITMSGLISQSKDLKELSFIYKLIKKHDYFKGERRKMYKQIINKRKELRNK